MTRTNRHIGEPPVLDPLPDHAVRVEASRRERYLRAAAERHAEADGHGGAMAILAAEIIALGALVVISLGGVMVYRQIDARIEALAAQTRAIHEARACDAPAREGDTAVITVRRSGADLLTRCHLVSGYPRRTP